MTTARAATTLAVAGLICAVGAPAAAAAPYSKAKLLAASLQAADVPGAFFVNQPKSHSTSYSRAPQTKRFEICVDKDGNKVFGSAPIQRANSSVSLYQQGSGSDITATRSASSDIYTYASHARTRAAWRALAKATERCAPTAGTTRSFQGVTVDVLATQKVRSSATVAAMVGFTVTQNVAVAASGSGGLQLWVGGFTAYRSVAGAIVRSQFANYSTIALSDSTLKPAWTAFTRKEAILIGLRLGRSASYAG